MTNSQYNIGDVVNGHRLIRNTDGALVWSPVADTHPGEAAPTPSTESQAHQLGDIVNGHRLTQAPDGSLVWLPYAPEPSPAKTRRGLLIAGAAVASLIVVGAVGSAFGSPNDQTTTADRPAPRPEVVQEAEEMEQVEVVPQIVVVPDVAGQTVADAATAMSRLGLKPSYSGEPDATVISVSPAPGTEVEIGSTVTFEAQQKPQLTMGQRQAMGSAESYLAFTAFSRQGLIEQLQYEGFSIEDASFAVDTISPDWNAQAVKSAKSYLDFTSFSRQGLIDQLIYEGYTPEQAEHGVAANGY